MCDRLNHDLIEILRVTKDIEDEIVVRWCSYCGAIVVDVEYDGRLLPGEILPMQMPRMIR